MMETIGAALKAAREQRRLTLAQVSETTRIRAHYLQALENDDISAMPSTAQARGFLRIYAEFLGLELGSLIPPAPATAAPPPETPAPPTPAGEKGPSGPGLLSRLRTQLANRLNSAKERGGAPEPDESRTQTSPDAEPNSKKKVTS